MFYQPIIEKAIYIEELSALDFRVFIYVLSCMNAQGESWPSTETMGFSLQRDARSIRRSIKSLVRNELLESFPSKRKSTLYKLGQKALIWTAKPSKS